jgi:hypothetical protein
LMQSCALYANLASLQFSEPKLDALAQEPDTQIAVND